MRAQIVKVWQITIFGLNAGPPEIVQSVYVKCHATRNSTARPIAERQPEGAQASSDNSWCHDDGGELPFALAERQAMLPIVDIIGRVRCEAVAPDYFNRAVWVANPAVLTPSAMSEAFRLIDLLCKENAIILRSRTRDSAEAADLAYPDS
jgi:hypothetical protein